MASKVYHGTCATTAATQVKVVKINNEQVLQENFSFEIGDLLVVYFQYTNEAENPRIAIYNDDTDQEVSTSNDNGKAIKTKSVEADAIVGAWDNGETVIFAYTANINNDNNYYWELINGAPSTTSIYGVTKLFGTNSTIISDWLHSELTEEDFKTSLTPGILKKFYNLLISDEEEGGLTPTIKLTWFPSIDTGTMEELGTLSLTTSKEDGIKINFPLTEFIKNKLHTSDLTNDGEYAGDGYKFISNATTKGTSFYYKDGSDVFRYMSPYNDNGQFSIRAKSSLWLGGLGEEGEFRGTYIDGIRNTAGEMTGKGLLTVYGDIVTKEVAGSKGTITSAGNIKENGSWLKDKYSAKLVVESRICKGISIAKNSSTTHLYVGKKALAKDGYKPIGIVGFNLDYNRSNYKNDATGCFLWECHLVNGGTEIQYAIRNTKNVNVVINATFKVLYVKDI